MECARYKAFLACVETRSFGKEAERLDCSPSAVYQSVGAFEKELGFPLLLRGSKGVRPTENAEKLLPIVRALLQQEERFRQVVAEINNQTNAGRITIGTYSSIAAHWLPAVIKGFTKEYPQIEIHLMEGNWKENQEWMDTSAVDFAFVSRKKEVDYDWVPLQTSSMIAVLPSDHPMARQEAYPLKNCQDEKVILPTLSRDEDALELLERKHISPKMEFNSLDNFSALAMIEQGMGMSIMNNLITRNIKSKVIKLPLDPPQTIELGIAIPSIKNASPAARCFIDYTVKQLRKGRRNKKGVL